ncbi:hypothetical protein MKZ91_04235 [Ensifer sp. MJa1]
MAGPSVAEKPADLIAGFPNLADQVRTHWIQGNTLFYIKDKAIALRDLQSGAETFVPFGNYEIKELIVRGNEIALTAKSVETFFDKLRTRVRFSYDAENDIYNGIVCRIDAGTCKVEVSGNYLMRSFQPYATGYIFTKTDWEDYSFGADIPTDVRSLVMKTSTGVSAPAIDEKVGGIHSLYVYEGRGNIYLDIRNASDLTFKAGEGVYELIGGLVTRVGLYGLNDRFKDLFGSQLRTNGKSWAISFRNVVDGKRRGLYGYIYCPGKKYEVDAITAVFLDRDTFYYLDMEGKVQKRVC